MDAKELKERLGSGSLTRRDLNRALAAAGLGLVSVPLLARAGAAALEDQPMMFCWEGYEEHGFYPTYIEKYGEPPAYSLFGDEEEAFAKIRAGFKADISTICSYKVAIWRDAGMLQPIDTARLTNWPDIIPSLKSLEGMVVDGKRYWIPLDWGRTSVIYRTDMVDIEEESWGLLWDERYAGRILMVDSLIDGVMIAAIYGGAENPFDMTPDEVAKTRELLERQLPLLRLYTNSNTDMENAMAVGEVVVAAGWDSSYVRLKEQGLPVAFMNPKEGVMTWVCGIVLMADADPAKLDRTYDLLDAFMSPEAGIYEITEWGYGHANKKAFEAVEEATLEALGLTRNPDDVLEGGIFQQQIKNEAELQTMFEEVKIGM